jgi:hypothetical protein
MEEAVKNIAGTNGPPRRRVFRKTVLCTQCNEWTYVLREGHRIGRDGFVCLPCRRSKYDCQLCMDSGHVLNVERALGRDEAGPGYPSAFDPCPKECAASDDEGRSDESPRTGAEETL